MEAFPHEGDMDMPQALAAYRDVGYRYMLMPDHVPQIDGRDPSGVAFAYCYGYIRALLDAMVPRPIDGDWMRSAQPKGEIAKPKRSAARPSRLSRVHKPAPAVRLTAASR